MTLEVGAEALGFHREACQRRGGRLKVSGVRQLL